MQAGKKSPLVGERLRFRFQGGKPTEGRKNQGRKKKKVGEEKKKNLRDGFTSKRVRRETPKM